MSEELEALEASKQLKDFVLEFVKNGLDRMFVHGSFDIIENALKRLEMVDKIKELPQETLFYNDENGSVEIRGIDDFVLVPNRKFKALEIIKECVGLKMSIDEDIGCLYVPITKCFQPLEQNIVIVGYVNGKDKIDLLKEVLL